MNTPSGIAVAKCRQDSPRGVVKAYAITAGDGVILIDCGFSPADVPSIESAVEQLGRTPADIEAVVLTHSHKDHVGALAAMRERVPFRVIAHELEADRVTETSGVPVDELVTNGSEIGGLRVIHVPGHTPGHIALYADEQRALFVGDAIFSGGGHLMPSPPYLAVDPDQAVASAELLARLPWTVDHLFPAHGDIVYEIAARNLSRLLSTKREF